MFTRERVTFFENSSDLPLASSSAKNRALNKQPDLNWQRAELATCKFLAEYYITTTIFRRSSCLFYTPPLRLQTEVPYTQHGKLTQAVSAGAPPRRICEQAGHCHAANTVSARQKR